MNYGVPEKAQLKIANWLKVKNKDILQDRRYDGQKSLALDRDRRIQIKPLNGGVERHIRIDFNIPDKVKSLHDFKFFRNVDADLTKQLNELELQRNLRYDDAKWTTMRPNMSDRNNSSEVLKSQHAQDVTFNESFKSGGLTGLTPIKSEYFTNMQSSHKESQSRYLKSELLL